MALFSMTFAKFLILLFFPYWLTGPIMFYTHVYYPETKAVEPRIIITDGSSFLYEDRLSIALQTSTDKNRNLRYTLTLTVDKTKKKYTVQAGDTIDFMGYTIIIKNLYSGDDSTLPSVGIEVGESYQD